MKEKNKSEKFINLIKQSNLVLLTFPLYFVELSKIANISRKNQNKDLIC